ncbi:hypothetical protein NUK55_07320 [Aeromonas veronii]|uniref:fimbrial protein n=1 Tax=Aeromonas veronii TaxID=654 RepID=UPI00214D5C8F|nr:hypothetical protein [Aeromonas veronii]MCR3970913.1 hypothetical protein [Aeromonas veronii]MCR3975241.1 hypothetical protein [Aeromonas veronii]
MLGNFLKLFIILICLYSHTNLVMATTCGLTPSSTAKPDVFSVTLSGGLYAGQELPIGTTLYTLSTVRPSSSTAVIECDGPTTITEVWTVINEPSGQPFFQPGTGLTGGMVYPTNVPGIGVALLAASPSDIWVGQTFTQDKPNIVSFPITTSIDFKDMLGFQIRLIKTGDIPLGAVINGASIPSISIYFDGAPGDTGFPIEMQLASYAGSMNIYTRTCTTPDYEVAMGTYDAQRDFHGVGTTTQWVDASINLENCPVFKGYNAEQWAWGSEPLIDMADTTGNLFKVELQPMTSIIDSSHGVFAVDDHVNGGGKATGVGIQMGYTETLNAAPTPPAKIWKPGRVWSIDIPKMSSGHLKIPLAARYYQVNNKVKPGAADGSVVFTISYL